MALTNPPLSIPEAVVTVPSERRHIAYGWIAAGVGLLASIALVVVLLVSSDSSTTTYPHDGLVERGSITALDRAVPQPTSRLDRPATIVDQGSIVAIDRAAQTSGR